MTRLPADSVMLDGEVVSLARDGTSSFRRLQEALSNGRTASLVYQAFDLLHLAGWGLNEVALVERKQAFRSYLPNRKGSDAPRQSQAISPNSPATSFTGGPRSST